VASSKQHSADLANEISKPYLFSEKRLALTLSLSPKERESWLAALGRVTDQ